MPSDGDPDPVESWDAGDLACGPLLLALKGRLERLDPGQVFRLSTRDEGAPVDVPAWCRLTGHRLVAANHPVYLLARRREEPQDAREILRFTDPRPR